MNLKKLSVIIPAYNAERFINKCVESLLNQSYKNIEIVIVINGSADSTPKLCEELANKYNNIKLVRLDPNQGINYARRAGVENATGEYIAFIDSDDYIDLNAYESAIKILEANNLDLVQFGIKLVDLDGKNLGSWRREDLTFNSPNEAYQYFLLDPVPAWNVWDKVYKREIFNNLIWPKVSALEDYCMSAQLFAKAQKFMTLNKLFYNYVQRQDSTLRLKSIEQSKHDEMITSLDLVINLTQNNFPDLLPEALWRKILYLERIFMDYAAAREDEVSDRSGNLNNLLNDIRSHYLKFHAELKRQSSDMKSRPASAYKSIYLYKYRAKTWVFVHWPKVAVLYSQLRLKIKDLFKF